jgi:hypothetical protein
MQFGGITDLSGSGLAKALDESFDFFVKVGAAKVFLHVVDSVRNKLAIMASSLGTAERHISMIRRIMRWHRSIGDKAGQSWGSLVQGCPLGKSAARLWVRASATSIIKGW